jgi:transketolase
LAATSHPTNAPSIRVMANAIRALAIDAVETAKSGHPGMPMGMADVAAVLFTQFLKFDPKDPHWPDRDRFILSAGHGSMLLYAALHLTGYEDFPIETLRRFRQLGSYSAGHPEYGHGAGVETTTGPLGQGIATAVGFAIAERHMNARFGDAMVDHKTYVIASDGDLMEGVSHEAIGLAGHLRLNRLIVLWDDNGISIDGPLSLSESGDMLKRFDAAGWSTSRVDGHDPVAVANALAKAQTSDKPVLIACKTIIGFGAPKKQGTASSHGAPLGADEAAAAKAALGWTAAPFEIPADILKAWRDAGARGAKLNAEWRARLAQKTPAVLKDFETATLGMLPAGLGDAINAFKRKASDEKKPLASRKASEHTLDAINPMIPQAIGGSADLSESNFTKSKDQAPLSATNYGGRYIHYGIREHGMAAAMNGMALHGGVIPYSGTFLVFSDYCRPSIRLAALMGVRAIHVMTHDSIGLGEDGPTHQPIEHVWSLRMIPNLLVFRPADTVETAECWELALRKANGPSVLALSRQNLPVLRGEHTDENKCAKGGYVLSPANGPAKVTLIATGSEVAIAIDAQRKLAEKGVAASVVSMPCTALFDAQPQAYRDATIPKGTVRISIEAGGTMGWERYVGETGAAIGMTSFGASAPIADLYKHFGITADAAVAAALARL